MNTDEPIRVEKRDGIGIVILNRPQSLNVLDTKTLVALGERMAGLEKDVEVKAVLLTGVKHFSAGADIKELREKDPGEAEVFSRLGHRIYNRIEDMAKPVIAAVGGYALGGGCELALACDIRIAAESAKLGLPELNIGLIPGFGGTQRLARLAGVGKAKEMILTGKIIEAKEAESMGLVNKVVKDEELMEKAEEIGRVMAQKSPITLKLAKALINGDHEIRRRLDIEISSFFECFSTEDHLEGINAFLEKRAPRFRGR